uniref:CSON015545 protein n=1 Tax=Culicoides sonorensis TaxID=179676 RepID=A0A336MDN8_CULSO
MLRELIAWVLNNYLGKYVENLNTAQLSVALLSGEVELENLPLRPDALRHLGLPLKVQCGSIGKVRLQIPVTAFRTAPWCIQIEQIYVVCGPLNLDEWDGVQEHQADLEYKLSSLDSLEARWRAHQEAGGSGSYYASSYSGWLSYGSSLVTNIVENLQLKINGVHVRYEDSITVENCRFACGITIESLTAESCDSNWTSSFNTNQQLSFKLVELNSLSLYWDPLIRDETLSETNSKELAEVISHIKFQHEYIIQPVSAQAKFKRDRSETPLRTRNRPRLTCDLVWNEIAITLSDKQYRQMVECVRGLDDISKYRRFRLLRPVVPIPENKRAWWLYAAQCHGLLKHINCDPSKIAKENLKYIKIYTKILSNPNETLTPENKEFKDLIEKERNYEELKLLREICMLSVKPVNVPQKRQENPSKGRYMLVQWFPQLWYGSNKQSEELTSEDLLPLESSDLNDSRENITLEDEILNALADSVENNSILKRDAVFGKFEFTLKKGTLDICSGGFGSELTPMLQLQFENLILNVESRPRSGSHFLGLSLGSILVKDLLTPNSEFPELIKPQVKDEMLSRTKSGSARKSQNLNTGAEPLFQLEYEKRPLALVADYRLLIKSQSLDIVYNVGAAKWLLDFVSRPHQMSEARKKIEAMKNKTKKELMKNWEHILKGHLNQRKQWAFEIDISAPQIIFVDNFADKLGSSIVVVDFGRLQLTNNVMTLRTNGKANGLTQDVTVKIGDTESDDESDMFLTPCSTPPGSQSSNSPTLVTAASDPLSQTSEIINNMTDDINEGNLLDKLYERYNLDLTDLQVLVCKGKERWNFASAKGSSTLHVLDRFNISLQIERRILHTTDPQYPSLTLLGRLPRLNVHVNENKIAALTHMYNIITKNSVFDSPMKGTAENPLLESLSQDTTDEDTFADETNHRDSNKLVIMQFSVDQMSLEVQSRGRSIAELQVTGVRAGLTQKAHETNVSLSVHGLLLVDAIQSFGPDFELLIASHRHVGMDSVSGSLRHSEPCSPCSPGSPDPSQMEDRRPTSPMTIHKALSSLTRASSPYNNSSIGAIDDLDALIVVDLQFIDGTGLDDDVNHQIANIQFNNLDIIANQETIVELLGFINRVFPKSRKHSGVMPRTKFQQENLEDENMESNPQENTKPVKTEITFDFHRLNILILRAYMRDNYIVARKVGTLTLCEAKINATLSDTVEVSGSLGGLQILDLTPEGINHQRILSVGKDPLTDPPPVDTHDDLLTSLTNEVYGNGPHKIDDTLKDKQALSFAITRDLEMCIDIRIRMASVWYIHCARFLQELAWCATEFKQYLKTLAKSIKEKATDMALGLVQPRGDNTSTPLKTPIINLEYGPNTTPRHKRYRTMSMNKTTDLLNTLKYEIKVDIVLETPVLVVPRSSSSPQVFVAHLGRISISNCDKEKTIANDVQSMKSDEILKQQNKPNTDIRINSNDDLFDMELNGESDCASTKVESISNLESYIVDIKNMNLYSLDTTNRKGFRLSALPRAEDFYSCQADAIPILHDTAIRLTITRDLETSFDLNSDSVMESKDVLNICGSVVKPLRVSLTRQSYEQLLETIDNIFKVPPDLTKPPSESMTKLDNIDEELDEPDLVYKRRLFNQTSISDPKSSSLHPKVSFDLPILIIELNNDKNNPLIEIALREFCFNYEQKNLFETAIQVSLRSVQMEDLLRDKDSNQRIMVASSTPDTNSDRFYSSYASYSCPDLAALFHPREELGFSLPDKLDTTCPFPTSKPNQQQQFKPVCPDTPPPSPQPKSREDNLVIYNSTLVNPDAPNFDTQFHSLRQCSSIDFNSLDLVISVQSWFVLLNFFGLMSDADGNEQKSPAKTENEQILRSIGNSKLDISVRSLNLVLINDNYEMAKANVSNAHFLIAKHELSKTVEGRLGSIYLNDLTSHGSVYKERFMTSGNEALNFVYKSENKRDQGELDPDATLKIQMSSVKYVHTKRFVAEIQKFFRDFSQLQTPVIRKIKTSDSLYNLQQKPMKLALEINAGSPIILLPLCAKSDQIIVGDLGEFSLYNKFCFTGDDFTISKQKEYSSIRELLDVMTVYLVHTDIFTGTRCTKSVENPDQPICGSFLDMGSYYLLKNGPSLLKDKCHLTLQVERNLDTWRSHNIPDISVHGTLSKLEAELDLEQYKLVRGFLSYNLGEPIDDLYEQKCEVFDSRMSLIVEPEKKEENVFTNLSITLELQDVSVRLKLPTSIAINEPPHIQHAFATPLACINFIKSTLIVDSFSDGSQDIDLVSKEILIMDSRDSYHSNDTNKNVFTTILQPINFKRGTDLVQAEVHSRKRNDHTKFTILLNNMRLMAILDWLEIVRDYLAQTAEPPNETLLMSQSKPYGNSNENATGVENMELKLNITDSELVVVENTNQWDTNAVILKSTTVVSYRPTDSNKIMSLNLNNLEVFSCILGLEEDTALSIIDPVTINLDLRKGTLDAHMQKQLIIRLSYHDVKMFTRIFQSLNQQLENAQNISSQRSEVTKSPIVAPNPNQSVLKLVSLGFHVSDCLAALEKCDNQLDDAALWLTQNAEPIKMGVAATPKHVPNPLDILDVEVKANCISITVIDDCKDADVPLLELSLTNIYLRQELGTKVSNILENSIIGPGRFKAGHLKAIIGSDYYNRELSGYEPLIEPWKCEAQWSYSYSNLNSQDDRLHLKISSNEVLRTNITSTAMELYQMVRDNWTQDYYSPDANNERQVQSPTSGNFRRRVPFIPFALKNDTGMKMWYSKLISAPGVVASSGISRFEQGRWVLIEPGALVHFSFGSSTKQRHQDSHKMNLHQIAVRVEGYNDVGPVSVDRVGVYFRHARPDYSEEYGDLPRARIVFAVTMEGSAQKLITVRSSLRLHNRLENPILLKMDNLFGYLNVRNWPESKTVIVPSNEIYNVPLSHVHAFLYVKPLNPNIDFNEQQLQQIQRDTSETGRVQFDGNEYWNKYEAWLARNANNAQTSNNYQFIERGIHWKDVIETGEVYQELRQCGANRDKFYRFVVAIKKEAFPSKEHNLLPGHTITLNPPLRLHNLLPCELLYKLPTQSHGRIGQSKTASIYEIDLEKGVELFITLDGYPGSGTLSIPIVQLGVSEMDLKLTDVNGRILVLNTNIIVAKGQGVQIYISAPFWLVNKTALPLIFRQEGVQQESAGQYAENEQARMVSPFIFSYSDPDAHQALVVRLGKRYGLTNPWSQPFTLNKDILHRHLKASFSNESFVIGIEVRRGKGKYAQTTVVTFSPRFQLYNRSSFKLQFAQLCYATTLTDPMARQTFIDALPGSHTPFHWPKLDKEQKLCVRLPDIADCLWSGGIPIYENQSLYINIRNINGGMHFLRLETVLQGATYYLVFTNAESLPPPIRIDNYSEVPIKFYQPKTRHQLKSSVRAHSAIAYVLDEPDGKQAIQIEAPGNDTCQCPLIGFEDQHLTYENFIYIAFSQTFENVPTFDNDITNFDVKASQLVLGVVDKRVVLVRKQPGDRSQLWRMNNEKQLEHEGSSPPAEPGKPGQQRLVLDLERPPQPMGYVNLIVAPSNPQRRFTQTWNFTEDGRLMCEHSNLCVQARGGFYGLRPGVDACLGMIVCDSKVFNNMGVPFEQAIERQKLRPGSGCLSVKFKMDGPIKTIEIKDVKQMTNASLEFDPSWKHVSQNIPNSNTLQGTETITSKSVSELHVNVTLERGIGLSLVSNHPCEELAYISLEGIALEGIATANESSLHLSIGDLQIDNQLFETTCPVMLYTAKNGSDSPNKLSALQLDVKMLPSPNKNAVIFALFRVNLKPMCVYLEERLLLRLADFFGLVKSGPSPISFQDESDYEAQHVVTTVLASNATRYYFGDLQLMPTQCRLSVLTASKLPPKYSEIKKSLGLTLIKFEDAVISFEKFVDRHHFETLEAYINAIKSHYKQELKWQAATILGSVDFLGNPLGFANDLSEGFSGLIFEGSVKSLVKNVTHGISNSTAKLTETLSDGLGKVVLDEQFSETRQRMLEDASSSGNASRDHMVAGLKGFGYGILGGMTSIVKHTYNGAQNDGIQGFISGLGKGIVGTVTKPVIGMLDLASETANAVKETSKSSNRILPNRKRDPRCVTGASGGLLPAYSSLHAKGQQHLFIINRRNFNEQFMAYEPCLCDKKDSQLRLLVSSENVWIFSKSDEETTVVCSYHLSEVVSCHPVSVPPIENPKSKKLCHYIEFCLTSPSKSITPNAQVKRPRVKCQSEEMAQIASRHINYARSIYEEREQTLTNDQF